MKNILPVIFAVILLLTNCKTNEKKDGEIMENNNQKSSQVKTGVRKALVDEIIGELIKKHGDGAKFRIERGVAQAGALWNSKDGDEVAFKKFCLDNFLGKEEELDKLFNRLSTNFEIINGNYMEAYLGIREPLDLDLGEKMPIDEVFAAYLPFAHMNDDFFNNKIAFYILLNFPAYSLNEKTKLGADWNSKQWAYARMGDMYSSRVPAEIGQLATNAQTASDSYINSYNIYVGFLVDDKGKTYFDPDKKLITHWNLRDELKSQYANPDGLYKQKMIFEVMNKIINQEIPSEVINSNEYQWNPFKNIVLKNGKEIKFEKEQNARYQKLLDNFKALKASDPYSPQYPTYISRKFDQEFEIPQKDVEALFIELISSETAKKVGELVKKRLGRDLQPFDIWYDGFKSRSSINQDELDRITKAKYPDRYAVEEDLPNILVKLGFTKEKAKEISSKITVDPSRGPGHAWGAEMKAAKAHLRTRIGKDGMDYKGYNIAVHEFGHNVEQTISLHDVDYYMLKGVPNTAFTEAWAFLFQKRDLDLLGMKTDNTEKEYLDALDNFWSNFEIMGVSVVDMRVWKWMYENPDCNAEQLKNAVMKIAKDVWNQYYAEIFGVKDQTILAIYSHMIDNPLYLSAYPLGHLIEFQIDKYMEGKNIGDEMQRIVKQGRIIPQAWMKGAVGHEISIKPVIEATEDALKNMK